MNPVSRCVYNLYFQVMTLIRFEQINDKIITIRNNQVILDSDVAELYGVNTRDINKAVKNNPDKFPENYIIQLCTEEKTEVVENFHNLQKLKFSPHIPKAFTERGLYMLATILKGPQAVGTTIAIIDAFAKLRELTRNLQMVNDTAYSSEQQSILRQSGKLIGELLNNDLEAYDSETTIELNLALLKVKHTVKKKHPESSQQA